MKRYKPVAIKEDAEEDKSIKAVQDLISLDWEADEDSKHKAVAIIDGLFNADTKVGDAFLKKISDFTSGLNVDDFKESCKKNPKKNMKEDTITFNNVDGASGAITNIISFMGRKIPNERILLRKLSDAIVSGLFSLQDMGNEGLVKKDAMYLCSLIKSADYSSSYDDDEF